MVVNDFVVGRHPVGAMPWRGLFGLIAEFGYANFIRMNDTVILSHFSLYVSK